jgi:glycosyltransferase involved in cell wall biosynthesis
MKPLVSILIPAYNAQEWIADTIISALGQTWSRKEIIVVDDGSTDQTLAIARQFASKDVVVVTQRNQGASAARNHALSLSQGDYIQWLDADDLLSTDKIAKQMQALDEMETTRTLMSSAWGYFSYRATRAQFSPTSLWCDLSPVEWLRRKMRENLFMQTATWLNSRELTNAAGPWDVRLATDDDGEYFCRVILASETVRFVPGAKVYYRITRSTRCSYVGHSDKKKDAQLLSMQLHVKHIRSLEDSERVRAACVTYLQNWLINFYPERPDLVEESKMLAASLGGRLEVPRLRWEYTWIKPLFGWGPAKHAQLVLPELKASVMRAWDRAMYNLENCDHSGKRQLSSGYGSHQGSVQYSARNQPNDRSRCGKGRNHSEPIH